eukprot:3936215-Rhodomonas_salina.2
MIAERRGGGAEFFFSQKLLLGEDKTRESEGRADEEGGESRQRVRARVRAAAVRSSLLSLRASRAAHAWVQCVCENGGGGAGQGWRRATQAGWPLFSAAATAVTPSAFAAAVLAPASTSSFTSSARPVCTARRGQASGPRAARTPAVGRGPSELKNETGDQGGCREGDRQWQRARGQRRRKRRSGPRRRPCSSWPPAAPASLLRAPPAASPIVRAHAERAAR